MTDLTTWARTQPGRCPSGFAPVQHPTLCGCPSSKPDEWQIFLTAVRSVARGGRVHQGDVRPLLRGRVQPKHVGQLYARAKREGLLIPVGKEPSNDTAGRNTHHDSPIYELRSAA
ncbi:MAG: hypothetical protein ACXVGA_06770 [Mycobacteriaceae bacterium]